MEIREIITSTVRPDLQTLRIVSHRQATCIVNTCTHWAYMYHSRWYNAAKCAQAFVRRYFARKMLLCALDASVRVQSGWRKVCAQSNYLQLRAATKSIQTCTRGRLRRKVFDQFRKAIVTLQARHRAGYVRARMRKESATAVKIQSYWRKCAALLVRRRQLQAVLLVQAAWRGDCARSKFHRNRQAAVAIQAITRGYLQRKDFTRFQEAIVALQARHRAGTGAISRRLSLELRSRAVAIAAMEPKE